MNLHRTFRLIAGTLALVSMGGLVGCRGQEVSGAPKAARVTLPSQILGLKVELTDVSETVAEVERPYFDSVAIFALREDELLRATLQVGRFNSLARPGSRTFRQRILQQIGSQEPITHRVGDKDVYVTAGNRQNIFIWFSGRTMLVLITHQDYPFPRTLLRRMLSMDLNI